MPIRRYPSGNKTYYYNSSTLDMKDTPTIDGDVSDSQAKAMLLTSPQDPLPNLVVKRDVGDLFEDLSQRANGEVEEYTSSQKSLMSAFEVSDLSNDAAIMLTESQFTRRTRSSTRLMQAVMKTDPVATLHTEELYFQNNEFLHIEHEMLPYQQEIDVYGATGWSPPSTFYVTVPAQKKSSRNVDYLFAANTLFAKMDVNVPLELVLPQGYLGSPGAKLRIYTQFDCPTAKGKPVERCPNHRNSDQTFRCLHFLQNDDRQDVEYGDASKMFDLTMGLKDSVNIKFMCFSSCSGINRKPISMVFEVTGPNLLPLNFIFGIRSCANPSRDSRKELQEKGMIDAIPGPSASEKRQSKAPDPPAPSPTSQIESKFRKRSAKIDCNSILRKRASNEDRVYTIQVYGYEKYKKVLHYIDSLEKSERYTATKEHAKFGEPNLFNGLTQITYETRVSTWLDEIAMGGHAVKLKERGITTMGDLCEYYEPDIFGSIGIDELTATYLNKAFLNWKNVHENTLESNI